ncbi:hypothetical protein CLIB1444_10S01618 [[Candida] jaroonii]|uniref:Uncharacterized protein n=1 Tax=[Candida] jaroonii TaxID=467808 RepID=A0ACA9YCU0_9ASCO|nr:hypothetical protein CLIB1444_10S01618 [[Candida] jaroonii]
MKQYLKHPVLINPARWTKVPKYQTENALQSSEYIQSLERNPFARNLMKTNSSNQTYRFPNGSLLKIITETKDNQHLMIPTIDEIDVKSLAIPSYVINNKKYLKMIDDRQMWKSHLPIKYKINNPESVVRNTNPMPDFIKHYQSMLEHRIREGLSEIISDSPNEESLRLVNEGALYEIIRNELIINLPNIDHEGYVAYEHKELCSYILALMMYLM